ncbi:MAG: DUF2851 family protein [Flavobacteriales bacterium]
MKEDFLHFLWKYKLFNTLELETTEGEPLSVVKPGTHNLHSGPDFSNAQIKIGDKLWNGNVEIHIKSSDWYQHAHQNDDAYKNVVLHVVYEDNKEVFLTQKGDLPVLELKSIIAPNYLEKYELLQQSRGWVPCANQFPKVDQFKVDQYLERLVLNRLQRKSTEVLRIYFECKKDWNEAFYRWLARSYGFKINSDSFEELAKRVPLKLLKKHSNSLAQVEALLFGQAGMLDPEFKDEYCLNLQKEYKFLAKKYDLRPMKVVSWRFSKTHPSNFPTKRIAQLAAFLCHEQGTFSKVLTLDSVQEMMNLLSTETSVYWKDHYRLDVHTNQKRTGAMGKSSVESLIINSICTVLYTYGRKAEDFSMVDRALDFLEKLKPERNSIINSWKSIGLEVFSAKSTQALIELKRENCELKKCLTCLFGLEILKA